MEFNVEDWEGKLLEPPVSGHPISAEMRQNVHRRVGAVTKESASTRVNRTTVSLASIAAICVAVIGVYFVSGGGSRPLVGTATRHQASRGWTTADVEQYILQQEKEHSVSDLKVIYSSSSDGFKVAFASFALDGQLKYGSIFDSPTQGTSFGTFTASQDKKNPLQHTETVGQNGFSLVTGVVVSEPHIKTVVVTFKNGAIRTLPVVNGAFWYFGKIGSTDTQSFTQQVLGVTDTGQIVENAAP